MLRILPFAAIGLSWLAAILPAQSRQAPFAAAGIVYAGDPSAAATDFPAFKARGFNSIAIAVRWADVEKQRGVRDFSRPAALLAEAVRAELRAVIRLETDPAPPWLLREFPAGRVEPESRSPANRSNRGCLDHDGVRAAEGAFITALTAAAAMSPALDGIDYTGRTGGADVCYCDRTLSAFRARLEQGYGTLAALNSAWRTRFAEWKAVRPLTDATHGVAAIDWQTFAAWRIRDQLEWRIAQAGDRAGRLSIAHANTPGMLADAASADGASDDWAGGRLVERFGLEWHSAGSKEPSADLALAFDGIRSAAGDRGWLLWTDGGPRARDARVDEDARFQAWAALSRGARGFFVDATDAASMASLAANLSRNAALFAPLRPRTARAALLYNRPSYVDGHAAVVRATAAFYRAAFERNIPIDVLHAADFVDSGGSGYDAILVPSLLALSPPVVQSLHNFVSNGGTLMAVAPAAVPARAAQIPKGMTDLFGVDDQAAASGAMHGFGAGRAMLIDVGSAPPAGSADSSALSHAFNLAGLRPEIVIENGAGDVEARVLESSDAMLMVALNHGSTARRVTFRFPPDMPEAIWQNMEAGAAVNFVAEATGPVYTHTIAPRDVLVLMIRKALR